MTKSDARSACRTVGMVHREHGKKITPELFRSEVVDRGLRHAVAALGEESAYGCAVAGWTDEDKRREALRKSRKQRTATEK